MAIIVTLHEHDIKNPSNQGFGSLSDAVSVIVVEELNGMYELTMEYPITGLHYSDILMRRQLWCKPNPFDKEQLFRIYEISKPINGIVTINASHISYDMSGYPVNEFSATDLNDVLVKINQNCEIDSPWSFDLDSGNDTKMSTEIVKSIRAVLGDNIKRVYNREFKFDNYHTTVLTKRGINRGVSIRYGKNLTDINQDENCSNVVTGVFPYWRGYTSDTDEYIMMKLPEKIVNVPGDFNFTKIITYDISDEFTEQPSEDDMRKRTEKYIASEKLGEPKVSLDVSFVRLSESGEYSTIEALDKVELGDTVNIEFYQLGVNATARCIETTYDVKNDRYLEIALGDAKSNLPNGISSSNSAIQDQISNQYIHFDAIIGSIKIAVADIEFAIIDKADIKDLTAANAKIDDLIANTARIEDAHIKDLTAVNADIINLNATKASIDQLEATYGKIEVLEAKNADIENLLAGNISGELGQLINLTVKNVVISNAVIKDIIAANIAVEDLMAGTISTNHMTIASDNGRMYIYDNTIQISDETNVRVQIGKDANNDYSLYVWDKTGNLMFDATGLHSDGIKNPIIRDDMISDNANISGGKINIGSVITEFNKETNTTLIKATKIQIDGVNQTLDVAFTRLGDQVLGTKTFDLTSIDTEYYISSSRLSTYNGSWITSISNQIPPNKYLWVRVKTTFSDAPTKYSTQLCLHESDKATLNITKVLEEYAITEDSKDIPSTGWTSQKPIWTSGKYIWTRTSLTYSDGSITTSMPMVDTSWQSIHSITTALTTNLSMLNGEISTIIKDSYIEEDGENVKIKDAYSSLKQTVNSIEARVNENTTDITNTLDDVTELNTKVTTVTNKQTLLEQNLDSFKTTVSSSYTKKTETTTIDGKVTALTSRVGSAESSISQLTNQIALKVGVTEVENIVDSSISGIQTELTKTKSEVAQLKLDTASITSRVTSTETTVSSHTSQINGVKTTITALETKVNDVSLKVTASNITAMVESQVSNGSSIIATKSFVTQSNDNVKFEFTKSGGGNLIRNGKGENGTEHWSSAAGLSSYTDPDYGATFKVDGRHGLWQDWIKLKPSTKYIFEAVIYSTKALTGYSSNPLHPSISSDKGENTNAATILETKQNVPANTWTKCYITFETKASQVYFQPWILWGGYTSFDMWITEISLTEGVMEKPYMPHSYEIYSGNTVIDFTGVTINNGGINIKNKNGQSVLSGDSLGNLNMNIWGSKLQISATGNRNTQMWCDYYDKFITQVPYGNADAGYWLKRDTGATIISDIAGQTDYYAIYMGATRFDSIKSLGGLTVVGSKNCLQNTINYGDRLINAYETAEYYFGDIGSGVIQNGECVIDIDDILQECVNTTIEYHVFTQVYSGSIFSIDRYPTYFIIKGVDGTAFSWELKAKRVGYENNRLDSPDDINPQIIDDLYMLLTDIDQERCTLEDYLLEEVL